MNNRQAPVNLGPGLTPREAAADALYRLVHGLDFNDADLIRSAFVEDGVLDISGLSPATGQDHPEQKGVENIINGVLGHVGPMATSHSITNVRVKLNDKMDRAEVMTYVIAQHFRPGEGHDVSNRDYALFGNSYWAEYVYGQMRGACFRVRYDVRNLLGLDKLSMLNFNWTYQIIFYNPHVYFISHHKSYILLKSSIITQFSFSITIHTYISFLYHIIQLVLFVHST